MKAALISLSVVGLLAGCQTTVVPVKQQFPEAPAVLLEPCKNLQQLDPKNTKLSVIVDNVVENYALYHECKIKNDSWVEWYRLQMRNSNG